MDSPIFDHPLVLDPRDVCKTDGFAEVTCTEKEFNQFSEGVKIQGPLKIEVRVVNHKFDQIRFLVTYEGDQLLNCSRSLEDFPSPIKAEFDLVVKYSTEVQNWNYVIDHEDEPFIELNKLAKSFSVFEFVRQEILLNEPMNPVKNPEEPFKWGESSETEEKIDPRWAKLLELRNKIDKE